MKVARRMRWHQGLSVRIFIAPDPLESFKHRIGDNGGIFLTNRCQGIEADDILRAVGRDDVNLAGIEPAVIAQRRQHLVEDTIGVSAMRI